MATATFLDRSRLRDPSYQAFLLLRTVFTVAPILFGLDKFANVMTNWPMYLAAWIDGILPGDAATAMHIVGVIEIAAGLIVLFNITRFGAYVVMAWLIGIALALLTNGKYFDIAVRDLVMAVGAWSLGRLAAIRAESTVRQPVGAMRTA